MARGRLRLGCMGSLIFCIGVAVAVCALLAPWSFHIGGRWTPASWWGVGRLRDSNGARYGMYVYFSPYFRGGASRLPGRAWPRIAVRGQAWVCTQAGLRYRFELRGDTYGAWLNSDGTEIVFGLTEPGNQRPRRAFSLDGFWHGAELVMDDRKSMFIHFLPDGNLTPARSYTSPVPERHATVTLSWGTRSDFDSLCRSL